MLMLYIKEQQQDFLAFAENSYRDITAAFIAENSGALNKAESALAQRKNVLKNTRRKETLCLRHVQHETAIEKSPWFI